MFGLGTWEIVAIVFLALLLFGGKKLPELARGAGKSIKTFKEEINDALDDDDKADEKKTAKNTSKKTSSKTTKSSAKKK